jgi:hypothetical protein
VLTSSGGEDLKKKSVYLVFLIFRYYLPLEKGVALHMNNFEPPSIKDDLCQFWLQLAQPSSSRKEVENVKVYRRTTGNQKSSLELSAQVSKQEAHGPHRSPE